MRSAYAIADGIITTQVLMPPMTSPRIEPRPRSKTRTIGSASLQPDEVDEPSLGSLTRGFSRHRADRGAEACECVTEQRRANREEHDERLPDDVEPGAAVEDARAAREDGDGDGRRAGRRGFRASALASGAGTGAGRARRRRAALLRRGRGVHATW